VSFVKNVIITIAFVALGIAIASLINGELFTAVSDLLSDGATQISDFNAFNP
jgi:hypothetical protein